MCRQIIGEFSYNEISKFTPLQRYDTVIQNANMLLAIDRDEARKSFLEASQLMKQASTLCASIISENDNENMEYAFYTAIRATLIKVIYGTEKRMSLKEMNFIINKLLQESIKSDGITNLFTEVKEEFSLFDSKFLTEVSMMKQKNMQ